MDYNWDAAGTNYQISDIAAISGRNHTGRALDGVCRRGEITVINAIFKI